ncbi:hypothetical protein DPMN_026395 [Dreissena polymorpha]|uniref:Uncharacterized protein n=1 Tax=Dreissena polymorpha TaxID=45954 RepID=A0A9D4LRK8_DREPO|nr:hypothetical protein DPMN_026395 [Dreissena polymorpha]
MAGHLKRHQYVLIPGTICLAFDNILFPGLIQLGVCYIADHYFRGSLPARVIDGWT